MQIDETFPRDYELSVLEEMPNTSNPMFSYPAPFTGMGELLLRVRPSAGKPWIASMRGGSTAKATALYTTPIASNFLAVVRGSGYLINASAPPQYYDVEADILTVVDAVLPAASARVILVAGFTNLAVYGEPGVHWVFQGISDDGIKLDRVDGTKVFGRTLTLPDTWPVFMIDVADGSFNRL